MEEGIKKYEGQILDLTTDTAFKRVFSDEHFKWYLSYIISFCTKLDINEIYEKLEYKNNFISSKDLNSKTGEADILVEVKNMVINLEMNKKLSKKLFVKNKEYVSMLDSINTYKSKNGRIRNKYIVQINISPKRRIPKTNTLLYEIVQMDKNLKVEDVYNNYIIYDINLEYLKKEIYNKRKLTKSEKGLLMFIETNKDKLTKIFKGDDQMEETIDELDATKFFEADIAFYESYDHEAFQREVDKEAREEEIAEAREEAKEEGLAEGRKEGITERNIEIAKNLLKNNVDIDIIINSTGLTRTELNKLKEI